MSSPTIDTEPTSAGTPGAAPRRVLCAYSPRWLSGPTPGYQGLCPTWPPAETSADRTVSRSR